MEHWKTRKNIHEGTFVGENPNVGDNPKVGDNYEVVIILMLMTITTRKVESKGNVTATKSGGNLIVTPH